MNKNEIINQLSSVIGSSLLSKFLDEYKIVKRKQLTEDWSDCLVHCAKFVELTMAVIKKIYDNEVDINKINFDKLYRYFVEKPKPTPEDEILLLAVPNAAKMIYTIRNKTGVVHVKEINPTFIDATVSSEVCDWILSQFILIKCKSNPNEAVKFTDSLIERTIPLMQEFEDGTLLVLDKNINFKEKLLLILYRSNRRVTNDQIRKMLEVDYNQLLTVTLRNLKKDLLIHKNNEGVKITALGIKKAEEIITNNFYFKKYLENF